METATSIRTAEIEGSGDSHCPVDDRVVVSIGSRARGVLHVERIATAELARHQDAWGDLAGRALEPNAFLEPGFALPLLRHILKSPRLSFVLVWEDGGPARFSRLVGLFPIVRPSGVLAWAGIARGLSYNQVCSGVPLIDRDHAEAVLETALAWIGKRIWSAGVMVLEEVPRNGAFCALLDRVCSESRRGCITLETYQRALLRQNSEAVPPVSSKRRKEQARLHRRLSEMGQRTYTSARSPAEVAEATERYLALEHQGWKGAWGTSLLSNPALAGFLREMTRRMAEDGKCRIDAIELDGQQVAMGIVLSTGDRAYFWKTAFDEAYAALSPGVQFTNELTALQAADPSLALTDSCAIADHPMIDRIWADRHTILHLLIGLRPGSHLRFELGCAVERLRRALRRRAKAGLARIRDLRAVAKRHEALDLTERT